MITGPFPHLFTEFCDIIVGHLREQAQTNAEGSKCSKRDFRRCSTFAIEDIARVARANARNFHKLFRFEVDLHGRLISN